MKEGYFNNVSVNQLVNIFIISEHSRDFNLRFPVFNFLGIILADGLKCGFTYSFLDNRLKLLSNIGIKSNPIFIMNYLAILSGVYHLYFIQIFEINFCVWE
jgi:hypothetical protein